MTVSGSLIDTAANVIGAAFLTNHGQDPYREAAVRLADRQMLISPERAAQIADMDRIVTVELLRQDLDSLRKVADETVDGGQQAGMRLAVRWMSLAMDRLLESPAEPVPPEIAAMVREGVREVVDELGSMEWRELTPTRHETLNGLWFLDFYAEVEVDGESPGWYLDGPGHAGGVWLPAETLDAAKGLAEERIALRAARVAEQSDGAK